MLGDLVLDAAAEGLRGFLPASWRRAIGIVASAALVLVLGAMLIRGDVEPSLVTGGILLLGAVALVAFAWE